MSVFYCEDCDNMIDSDFVECHEVDENLICEPCHNNYLDEQDILKMIAEYEQGEKQSGLATMREEALCL